MYDLQVADQIEQTTAWQEDYTGKGPREEQTKYYGSRLPPRVFINISDPKDFTGSLQKEAR